MYGSVGSVSFEVFVDGEKKFDSGVMGSRDPQKFIELDINEAKELKLVVTDGEMATDLTMLHGVEPNYISRMEITYSLEISNRRLQRLKQFL